MFGVPVSQQELKHILVLSKLKTEENELPKFEQDLNNTLEMFNNMASVNTDNLAPMISPLTSHYLARDDNEVVQENEDQFMSIAPAYEAHHFIVPKVIE